MEPRHVAPSPRNAKCHLLIFKVSLDTVFVEWCNEQFFVFPWLQHKGWTAASSTLQESSCFHILCQKIDLWFHACVYNCNIVVTDIRNADASLLVLDSKGCGRSSLGVPV